jgi:phosphodiesterase/alkaline phosphatase D-like protein
MLLDDHEIDDNWEPVATPDSNQNHNKMVQGREAFKKYQRGRTGAPETFEFDGFHFFMLDTRTERMHRKVAPSLKTAELVSPGAMARLKEWLRQSPGPKFVMTPSILLPRHRRTVQRDRRLDSSNLSALHSDSWDGYPNTLRDVLAFIAENKIERVVFLSGDEHRSCIAQAELFDLDGKKLTTVHSVHTAAMYAPYPFANALGADFLLSETIDIAGRFRCVVTANLPSTGEGATYLTVRKQGSDWWLNCEFAGGQNLPLPL